MLPKERPSSASARRLGLENGSNVSPKHVNGHLWVRFGQTGGLAHFPVYLFIADLLSVEVRRFGYADNLRTTAEVFLRQLQNGEVAMLRSGMPDKVRLEAPVLASGGHSKRSIGATKTSLSRSDSISAARSKLSHEMSEHALLFSAHSPR
jgi:hypothetical protein